MAHARRLPEGFECIEQLSDSPVSGVDIIRSDVFPNLVEIELDSGAENVAAHARGFRRCSDLRCNRERVAIGSTTSPRSRAARRRPSSPLNSASWTARAGVVLLQKPQGFPDDLACRVVAARLNFCADELFELRGKRDVHGKALLSVTLAVITNIVNLRYCIFGIAPGSPSSPARPGRIAFKHAKIHSGVQKGTLSRAYPFT